MTASSSRHEAHEHRGDHGSTQADPVGHPAHEGHDPHVGPHVGHDHHGDHGGHDTHEGHSPEMFREKFWLSLILTLLVVFWSDHIQRKRSPHPVQGVSPSLAATTLPRSRIPIPVLALLLVAGQFITQTPAFRVVACATQTR